MKSWTDDSPIEPLREKLKYGSLGQLLSLIFVPVVVVWTMSLWLIMLMWLMSVIKWWENYADRTVSTIQVTGNSETWSTLRVPAVMDLGIKWSLFKKTQFRTLWVFGEAMMMFFAMAILRSMVKIWFAFSSIAEEYSKGVFSTIWNFAKTIPIPVAWWISLWAIEQQWWPGGVARKVSWLEAMQADSRQRAKSHADKMEEMITGKKKDYAFDIDPTVQSGILSSAWVASNINSLQESIAWKSKVRYAWNIKEVFEEMKTKNDPDFKAYFAWNSKKDKPEELRKTVWRANFVRDVLEGKALNPSNYRSDAIDASLTTAEFTPKAST